MGWYRTGLVGTTQGRHGQEDTVRKRMGRAKRMGQDETEKDNTRDVDLTLSSSVWSCLGVL